MDVHDRRLKLVDEHGIESMILSLNAPAVQAFLSDPKRPRSPEKPTTERMMFSTNGPFENTDHTAEWFDAASISEADRTKIGRTNAKALFKL